MGTTLGNEVGLFLTSFARFLSNLAGLLVGFIEGGENRQSWLGVSRICRNRCTILFGEGYCFIFSCYDFSVSQCVMKNEDGTGCTDSCIGKSV